MSGKAPSADLEKQIEKQKRQIASLVHQLSELRYLAIVLEDSNDAITAHDFDGNIKVWNKGAREMYG